MFTAMLKKVELHVRGLFETNYNPTLVYHNLTHTEKVVARCTEIAAEYTLTPQEKFILLSAAWLHDTGHLMEIGCGHEAKSVEIMRAFFQKNGIEKALTDQVAGCIMATAMPQQPKTLLEQILCDADVYNLGTDEFKQTDVLVKAEIEQTLKTRCCNWDMSTLNFLKSHIFFTDYCNRKLKAGKEKNVHLVESRMAANA